ncbi:hypothetical protein LWM68_14550 [Niabella sp. W65]|nr:hypothetical protein [Niabella sp. W65]MCH7363862.1 hypothetical protein [Niabella sp. W65]ULT39766.1 hypothetical protein KRR40_33390 [Niabella sp. I65]
MVKCSPGGATIKMYAHSGSSSPALNYVTAAESWKKISIGKVKIRGGKVEVGFIGEGQANAFCCVDDVTLIKEN